MELIVYALYLTARVILNLLLIAAMAIPAGFGLSLGYHIGKATWRWFGERAERKRLTKKHSDIIDEFAAVEQPAGA